jgi:hypothetical protein
VGNEQACTRRATIFAQPRFADRWQGKISERSLVCPFAALRVESIAKSVGAVQRAAARGLRTVGLRSLADGCNQQQR